MTRVVFYFDPDWAFGSIHYELCKYLLAEGVNARLLPWDKSYTKDEMTELCAVTDFIVSNPQGYRTLITDFGVPVAQIIVIVHAVTDLYDTINNFGIDEFIKPYKFAVVSSFLAQKAKELGVHRRPILVPLGVNVGSYTSKFSPRLETIGFASVFSRNDPHVQQDLKRGYLVEQCARAVGLQFKVATSYHHSYVTMPGFYQSVDCVVVASTEEGAGLPALEAGAAGRLVISTPVGHWVERCGAKGGETVPVEADKFMHETTKLLQYYKANPKAYQRKCREIQHHAQTYDWSQVINAWVKLLS